MFSLRAFSRKASSFATTSGELSLRIKSIVQGVASASKPSTRHLPEMNAETRLSPKASRKIPGHCDFSISLTHSNFFMLSKNPNLRPFLPKAMSRPNTTATKIHPRTVMPSSAGASCMSMSNFFPVLSLMAKVSHPASESMPSP